MACCDDCKYDWRVFNGDEKDKQLHCGHCGIGLKGYLNIKSDFSKTSCVDCEYYEKYYTEQPCSRCRDYDLFVERNQVKIIDDMEQDRVALEKSITEMVNIVPLSVSPCKLCDYYESGKQTLCEGCCFFYVSKFKLREGKKEQEK